MMKAESGNVTNVNNDLDQTLLLSFELIHVELLLILSLLYEFLLTHVEVFDMALATPLPVRLLKRQQT